MVRRWERQERKYSTQLNHNGSSRVNKEENKGGNCIMVFSLSSLDFVVKRNIHLTSQHCTCEFFLPCSMKYEKMGKFCSKALHGGNGQPAL